jgi:hypothetical protein
LILLFSSWLQVYSKWKWDLWKSWGNVWGSRVRVRDKYFIIYLIHIYICSWVCKCKVKKSLVAHFSKWRMTSKESALQIWTLWNSKYLIKMYQITINSTNGFDIYSNQFYNEAIVKF